MNSSRSPRRRTSSPRWSITSCAIPTTRSSARWSTTARDRKSTRLNSSHLGISYAVFCLKKKKKKATHQRREITGRREGRRNLGRSKANERGEKVRVGTKSKASDSRALHITGQDVEIVLH